MLNIIEHASKWKGSRAPPEMHVLQRLCTLHELKIPELDIPKLITKTTLIQILIQKFM